MSRVSTSVVDAPVCSPPGGLRRTPRAVAPWSDEPHRQGRDQAQGQARRRSGVSVDSSGALLTTTARTGTWAAPTSTGVRKTAVGSPGRTTLTDSSQPPAMGIIPAGVSYRPSPTGSPTNAIGGLDPSSLRRVTSTRSIGSSAGRLVSNTPRFTKFAPARPGLTVAVTSRSSTVATKSWAGRVASGRNSGPSAGGAALRRAATRMTPNPPSASSRKLMRQVPPQATIAAARRPRLPETLDATCRIQPCRRRAWRKPSRATAVPSATFAMSR